LTLVKGSILGNKVLRKEDPTLLTGDDRFLDDMDHTGGVYLHFARSPFAHASMSDVDISGAESMPGVVGVWTAATLGLAPFPLFMAFPNHARPPLAADTIRYVGEPYAVVAANSPGEAVDAAELIFAEFEPKDAVTDAEAARKPDSPLLFPAEDSNICFHTELGADSDPLEGADVVVEGRVVSQRLAGVPMEPNGAVARPVDGGVELWISCQNPVQMHGPISQILGLDPSKVRVATPAVGGGFGSKGGFYPEQVIAAKIALTLDRPAKWVETRSENMVTMTHGRDMFLTSKMGFTSDGHIVGLDCDCVANAGAYPAIGPILTTFTQTMIQGVYNIPKVRFIADSVVTNTTTIGAYRGAGRPEATQMLERIIDMAADKLGIDPAELRRKNFLQPDQFPYTTISGANYDNGEYEKTLDAAIEASNYESLLATQAERRASGSAKQLGIGFGAYVEVTAPAGLHVEYGAVEVQTDGTILAKVGTSSHGQGHDTAFSMIVAEHLGVQLEDVKLVQSDTKYIPRGSGTVGSRSLQTAGSAVFVASENVLEKAKKLASHLLEAAQEDIVTGGGGLQVTGVPSTSLTWAELAIAAADPSKLPEGMEPGMGHELDFDGQDATFPFGVHVSLVEVDTDTGAVEMLKHWAVDDCGKILNPMMVSGQQHGGIAQGAAQALFEQVVFDEDGNPVTSNLMDYAIPSAAELPFFDTSNTETPTFRNPLGAKGIGESGTIGSTPAIHNAVIDAVSHLGVKHIDMPLTAEKVWRAVNTAS
jgi:carbon-monoxide dehydrogenase large subunit